MVEDDLQQLRIPPADFFQCDFGPVPDCGLLVREQIHDDWNRLGQIGSG